MYRSSVRSSRVQLTIAGLLVGIGLFSTTLDGSVTSHRPPAPTVQATATAELTSSTMLPGGAFGWD